MDVQMVEEVEDVHMEEVDVVDVQMDYVEVVDVPMDEALAELELADMLGALEPDADEEVSKYAVSIKNPN